MNASTSPATLLPAIGAAYEGGFYGGQIRIGEHIFAIAWAPKAEGETKGRWLDSYDRIKGADSPCDTAANTHAMAVAGSPLAIWAAALDINGHRDWCVPARDVLEMGYRFLKPTTQENDCSYRDGENSNSVPPAWLYTEDNPVQTTAPAFVEGEAEAFEDTWYWSSTQYSDYYAFVQYFYSGYQSYYGKSYEGRCRAVRLIQLTA